VCCAVIHVRRIGFPSAAVDSMAESVMEVDSGESECIICQEKFDSASDNRGKRVKATSKGIESVRHFSALRDDERLQNLLSDHPAEVYYHSQCHKRYTNERLFQQERRRSEVSPEKPVQTKLLRSSSAGFLWAEHCFLCAKPVKQESHHGSATVCSVGTMNMFHNIKAVCKNRNDDWALQVSGRIESCNDLFAVDAVYHKQCHSNFLTGRRCPVQHTDAPDIRPSRPVDDKKMEAFENLCTWLECSTDLYSISELHDVMIGFAACSDDVYSETHMQRLLMQRYEGDIVLSQVAGRNNVVCFKNTASRLLNDKWYSDRKKDIQEESLRIVTAAAKLICGQIRSAQYSTTEYPKTSSFGDICAVQDWIPSLLLAFIKTVVKNELKQVAICHSIVQAARLRSSLSPLLFGVGISLDHAHGSRSLLDMMARLGFCISYDEVSQFKQCAVQCDSDDLPASFPQCLTQWAGDNMDHNVNTIDGLNTFHGMGVVSMSTSVHHDTMARFSETAVPRLHRVRVANVIKNKGIPLLSYSVPQKSALSTLELKPFAALHFATSSLAPVMYDLSWQFGCSLCDSDHPRPNWSGFVQKVTVSSDAYTSAADIRMLPVIDLNPNDVSCIFSTLVFVERQAKLLNMQTACITFDQPLWIKAVNIALSERMNVVCRLGGFHTVMSYLGALGTIMAGSGLTEALQTCYGSATITHMMTGKAESRAVRGHMLVDSALNIFLIRDLINEGQCLSGENMEELKVLYSSMLDQTFTPPENIASVPECVEKLHDALVGRCSELAEQSRTAKLWINYMQHVQTLRDFIRADRISDWMLHLASLKKMLPLFAAAGHRNYAKSVRLYLQLMSELDETHPWLFDQFVRGGHAVRRSDRYWAGLATDLIIEQTMMRTAKSRGGLTHGCGMTESVRIMWIKSLHRCATIHSSVLALINTDSDSQDTQHAEMGRSRSKRDFADLEKMIGWFDCHNPFVVTDARLRSLTTGVIAGDEDNINCDNVQEVGTDIMLKMDRVIFSDIVLKKAAQAKTLADLGCTVVGGSSKLPVDSTVLFSRLLIVAQRREELASYFAYELTAVPTALFKDAVSMRKTDKSQLAKELMKMADCSTTSVAAHAVVDGGWLLHKVKWQPGGLYSDIVTQYERYVVNHFGRNVTVVFDGYDSGPSTKDYEHTRRAAKRAPDVAVELSMPSYSNQSAFLANEHNKKQLVAAVMNHLTHAGISAIQATGDADTLIVRSALQKASSGTAVTVVANDTDVFIMLLYHFSKSMSDVYMHIETSKMAPIKKICIRKMVTALGECTAKQLPVLHALTGCDTTSALYGHGKAGFFRMAVRKPETFQLTEVIGCSEAPTKDVVKAGLQLLVLMYGGTITESLNRLRYDTYMNAVANRSLPPRPEKLPPTEAAAKQHILRVHLQVVEWQTLKTGNLKAEDWGWRQVQQQYFPTTTDLPPAPADLMDLVKCKCKVETRRPCMTMLCTCMKHGLPCLPACKHCCGRSCGNAGAAIGDAVLCCADNDDIVELLDDALAGENIPDECLEFDMPWLDEEVVSAA